MSLECALTTLTLLPIAHDLISSDDDDDDDDGVHDDQSYTSVASVTSFAGSQLTSNLNDETSMSISAHLAIDDQVFYRVGGKKKQKHALFLVTKCKIEKEKGKTVTFYKLTYKQSNDPDSVAKQLFDPEGWIRRTELVDLDQMLHRIESFLQQSQAKENKTNEKELARAACAKELSIDASVVDGGILRIAEIRESRESKKRKDTSPPSGGILGRSLSNRIGGGSSEKKKFKSTNTPKTTPPPLYSRTVYPLVLESQS